MSKPLLEASGFQEGPLLRIRGVDHNDSKETIVVQEEMEGPEMCQILCWKQAFECEKARLTWAIIWGIILMATAATITISIDYTVRGKEKHIVAWYSAGIFVVLAISLSL